MNSLLTEEQESLEQFCQRLLENEWPLEKALRAFGKGKPGHDEALWKTLAEAGWIGLPFSPDYGGAGGDLIDLGLVYRAAGERLVPASFYATVFSAFLIDAIGTVAEKAALLPAIIAGDAITVTAHSEPQAPEEARFFETVATESGAGWTLSGHKSFVPYLDIAKNVLVLSRLRSNYDRERWGLFRVPAAALTGKWRPVKTMGGETLFDLDLTGVTLPADALLGGGRSDTLAAFADVVEKGIALQCMEMIGGVQTVVKMTIEYTSQREQGGRVLGAYQAVQHLLSNVAIQLNGARVAALKALDEKSKGRPAPRAIAVAKVACGECYTNATVTAHQVWGAMGYARETGLYLWSERAKVTDAWFGPRATHLRRLAGTMGL